LLRLESAHRNLARKATPSPKDANAFLLISGSTESAAFIKR
jgi:hypothetical protein